MTSKLDIMQICGSRSSGGAEAFFLRLCRALHRHEGVNVIPVVRRNSWLAERLAAEGIPYEQTGFGGKFDLFSRYYLARLIRRHRPHAVQCWMKRASGFLPRGLAPSVGRLGGYYNLKYYVGFDHLIGNTPDICRYIREGGWPAERVHHIPNFAGTPPDGFKAQGETVRKAHHIPDEAVVLFIAARLHPVKGIDVALSALAQLPEHVHLLVAGSGDEEAALRAQAEASGIAGRVHFLGWVNDITPFCAAADIFVVPSRHEPLGNVVLEAWIHAMPLVSSAAEGPSQLVTPGKNGLLVPPGDTDALAAAIRLVIDDRQLAISLAENGIRHLKAHFSEKEVIGQYLDLYRHMQEDTSCAA